MPAGGAELELGCQVDGIGRSRHPVLQTSQLGSQLPGGQRTAVKGSLSRIGRQTPELPQGRGN